MERNDDIDIRSASKRGLPPPQTDAIDALIDAVTTGRSRVTGESGTDTVPSSAATSVSSPVASASGLVVRRFILRWVAPSLAAFLISVTATVWGLRRAEPRSLTSVQSSEQIAAAPAIPSNPMPSPAPEPTAPSTPPEIATPIDAPLLMARAVVPLAPMRAAVKMPAPLTSAVAPQVAAAVPAPAIPPAVKSPVPPAAIARQAVARASTPVARLPVERKPQPALIAPAPTPMLSVPAPALLAAAPGPSTTAPSSAPAARDATLIATPPLADAASTAAEATVAEEDAVRVSLDQYLDALEKMNVDAAADVYPTVDQRALARAFAALKSQGVDLDGCDVDVSASTAIARCEGTLHFVTKFGGAPKATYQEWRFTMRKQPSGWKIADVIASPTDRGAARVRGSF